MTTSDKVDPEVLAVIPARGGSKSIPGKNLVPLAGRPMIEYTFEAANASRYIRRTILSTDDPDIVALARHFGIPAPFLRPADLALDESPMLPVIQHAVRFVETEDNYRPEYVVLLQPTSPLRTGDHIDCALEILFAKGADSVVSVVEVPHRFAPNSLMRLEGTFLVSFTDGPAILRRQDKPTLYARNGPAVLCMRRESVDNASLYDDNCVPYVMDAVSSLDVDTRVDLRMAETFMRDRVIGGGVAP